MYEQTHNDANDLKSAFMTMAEIRSKWRRGQPTEEARARTKAEIDAAKSRREEKP